MDVIFKEQRVRVGDQEYTAWFFPHKQMAHTPAFGGLDVAGVTSADEAVARLAEAIESRLAEHAPTA